MSSKLAAALTALALLTAAAPGPAAADTNYVYDSAGRLIQVTYSNGVVIEYRYDAAGNRQQVITSTAPSFAPRAAANKAPVAAADQYSVAAGGSAALSVLSNDTDADGNRLTVTGVTRPSGGAAAVAAGGGSITFDAPQAPGRYTFNYTVSDGSGATATNSVTVNVRPRQDSGQASRVETLRTR
jgi:YD repeat-containing protein